jgi:metal-responsive CopG/Arc/MetJ family transcriptional regulator
MATSIKTAISMREELFNKVDNLAKELQVSRSKLFVMAVQDFIKKKESEQLLSQINKAFHDHPDAEESVVQSRVRQKQRQKLEKEPW